MLNNTEKTMEKIVALCKNRGFIFAGSDIYGGLANTWDYGPLGARMKNNVKDTWRKRFIQERRNSYEVDADILMHPRVWEASGHIASFSDPLLDCKECKMRHRADTLIENFDPNAHPDKMTKEEMFEFIKAHSIPCPHCGKPMKYLAQIQWDTVFDCAEGTLYVEFCPDCQIVSMQHQQT